MHYFELYYVSYRIMILILIFYLTIFSYGEYDDFKCKIFHFAT